MADELKPDEPKEHEEILEPQEQVPEQKTYDEKYIKGLRDEAATRRKELKLEREAKAGIEAKLARLQKALLGTDEKTTDEEFETKLRDAEKRVAEANQRLLRAEVSSLAQEGGFRAPRRVFALMQDEGLFESVELTGSTFAGLSEALAEFKEKNPDLLAGAGEQSQDQRKKQVGSGTGNAIPGEGLQAYISRLSDVQLAAIEKSDLARRMGREYAVAMTAWQIAAEDGKNLPKPTIQLRQTG